MLVTSYLLTVTLKTRKPTINLIWSNNMAEL